MSTPRLASALAPALALALVLPLAGCSDGGDPPRLVVGDGPPAEEWGLIGADGGGQGAPAKQPPRTTSTASAPDRSGRDPEPDGEDEKDDEERSGEEDGEDGDDSEDGDEEAWQRGPLVVLAPGDAPGTFVVTGHAADADWGDVAVAADAGSWTLVLEGGSPGQYDFGEGVMASPDPGDVRDGDRLRFCDRSSADGVTGTYMQVDDVAHGDTLLRERIQASPC